MLVTSDGLGFTVSVKASKCGYFVREFVGRYYFGVTVLEIL